MKNFTATLSYPIKICSDIQLTHLKGANGSSLQLLTPNWENFLSHLKDNTLTVPYQISEIWQVVIKDNLVLFSIENNLGKQVIRVKLEGLQAAKFNKQLMSLADQLNMEAA